MGRERGREVFPVARPRRLRYKLMLGLGLVVGSVALLVGGTLYGIRAYNSTVKTTERKMVELHFTNLLVETLKGPDTNRPHARDHSWQVREHLRLLKETNEQTVAEGLDPDDGARIGADRSARRRTEETARGH